MLSDVAAQIAGSVGLAGSANIGAELRHVRGHPRLRAAARRPEPGEPFGPAPRRRDDARPHRPARDRRAGPQRLARDARGRRPHVRHLRRRGEQARRSARRSSRRPSSSRLGKRRQKLKPVAYAAAPPAAASETKAPAEVPRPEPVRELKGVDVFVNWESRDSDALAAKLVASRRTRVQADDADEPRRQGLAERPRRDVPRRSVPLPAHGRERCSRSRTRPSRRSSAASAAPGSAFASGRQPVRFRRRAGLLARPGRVTPWAPNEASRRHPDGLEVRLGGHEERLRDAVEVRRPEREPRALGPPHAEGDLGVRHGCGGARPRGSRRGRRRRGASRRRRGRAHDAAGARSAHGERLAQGARLAPRHRADAGRDPRRPTFAIGKPGAVNAGLFAVAILAGKRPELFQKLADFRAEQAKKILEEKLS